MNNDKQLNSTQTRTLLRIPNSTQERTASYRYARYNQIARTILLLIILLEQWYLGSASTLAADRQ
jgi:hypothetical protein